MVQISGKALAILGMITALVLVLVLVVTWRHEYFCYRVEAGTRCYFSYVNCNNELQQESAEVTRGCWPEANPFTGRTVTGSIVRDTRALANVVYEHMRSVWASWKRHVAIKE
jgi:hypothetical protein